jgi:hypothetical protein
MSLERRDPQTGRYLLYASQAEHSQDCERYPYEQLPFRIFLDTNVINRLDDWGAQIFEFEDIPDTIDQTLAHDIEALRLVLHGLERTSITLFASDKTLEELGNTREPSSRHSLLQLGVEFVHRQHDPD